MRKWIFLLGLVLTIGTLSAQETDKDFSTMVAQEAAHHSSLLEFRSNPQGVWYDLTYARMEWTVDPNVYYISGTGTYHFTSLISDLEEVYMDCSYALTINSVKYNGALVVFEQLPSDLLKITLPQPLESGETGALEIIYAGTPQSTGFGSFNQAMHDGDPIIWTLSEPYGAKDWWPTKQDLNDKIDSLDVLVTTPSGYRVASNGVLIEESENNGEVTYHWKHRYPIPAYLVAIAVTNYAYYSDWVPYDEGAIEVLNYVFPENLSQAQSQTTDIVEIMTLFNDLFGLYPFADEKYGHAQFSWGGGMEHQTMSFMGNFNYDLQAHELAHQWFGDKITCGSWEDIWLNEGFATYLTGLTKEYLKSPQDWHNWKQGRIDNITSKPDGSVWVNDTTSLWRIFSGRLSYNKGAMLLHMLRWKLGDADFFQGIENYLNDPMLDFGYAHTADLQSHLEDQSGQSLDEFLNDWFYGEGYPSYDFTWYYDGGDMLYITANQETSHPSVDFFEMPLPIRIMGEGDTMDVRLDHEFDGQVLSTQVSFEPNAIEFDPDLWLISKNNQVVKADEAVLPEETAVTITPNPGNGLFDIQVTDARLQLDRVRLLDARGREVGVWIPDSPAVLTLDIRGWQAGMYFCYLESSEGVLVKKIIKQ